MKLQKKNLLPTVVLVLICLSVALLLAAVNLVTRDVIAENDRIALENSLNEALPGEGYEELPITDEMLEAVKNATAHKITLTHLYRETSGRGFVVTLENSSGYTGKPIAITIGIDATDRVSRIILTNNPETKITKEIEAYPDAFAGLGAEESRALDVVAGVTYSSKAIKESVAAAIAVVWIAEGRNDYWMGGARS